MKGPDTMMKIPRLGLLALALAATMLLAPPARGAVSVTVRPGAWSDVVKAPDGFQFVRATALEVVVERPDGSLVWRVGLPEPILYLNAAVSDTGVVQAVAQGNHTGDAYLLTPLGANPLIGSFGQNATDIAWLPGRGFVYYVQTSPTTYQEFDSGACAPTVDRQRRCVTVMAATSQGFRDIQPDGTVRRGDDFISTVIRGRMFWSIAQRGPITVGQCDPPGICVDAEGKTFTVFKGNAFEPHLALAGSTFAIATRSEFGAALVIVSPPYPAADVTVVDPPIKIDPPDDPKDPPPAGPNQLATVQRIRSTYPTPLGARHWQFLVEVAQATGGKLFQKDGAVFVPPLNLSVSQDIIIVGTEWIDILGDGENRAIPAWDAHPDAGEPTRWIDVRGIKLPGGPVDPPPPDDPKLDARVKVLEQELVSLRSRVIELHTVIWNELAGELGILRDRLEHLEARPPVDLSALGAAIDAALATYEVNGKTLSDRLGLQHVVRLAITKRK